MTFYSVKFWIFILFAFLLGAIASYFCCCGYCINSQTHLFIDIIALVIALLLVVIICVVFRENKHNRKTNGYYLLPIALIAAILIVLFGIVDYDTANQALSITRLKICNCEFCLTHHLQEEGSCFCDTYNTNPSTLSDYIRGYFSDQKENENLKKAAKKITCQDMLKICCSKNARDYVENLRELKINTMKDFENDKLNCLLEIFILNEMGLKVMQKAISSCHCGKGETKCTSCIFKCDTSPADQEQYSNEKLKLNETKITTSQRENQSG